MKTYDIILFDLDGTLTDPGEGITNSVAYALEKFGIKVEDRKVLEPFIGPPLAESFEKFYGISGEDAWKGVEYYREYFRGRGIFENEVYEGIPELLAELKAQGKRVALATSKPEHFAKQILEHFDLMQYMDFVGGATMDEKRVTKADVIAYVLESCSIGDRGRVLMVGDREHDIIGAKANGVDSVGVEFGYGDYEELSKAGVRYIVGTVKDLQELLCGKN